MNTIDIHGKPYVMVKDRVIHFNKEYPNGCIRSKMIDRIDGTDYPNIVIFEATVIPDVDKPERYFTGHAEEEIGSSQINKTSALENCETSAIGRALAMMGIGVDESFASGDEVANAVFQQKEQEATGVSYQNTPKTAENGLKCPKCSGGMADNREIDGKAKKSQNHDKLVAEGKTRGLYQPFYKCLKNSCDGMIWDEPYNKEYTPEQLSELESIENEQKTNEELFNEI